MKEYDATEMAYNNGYREAVKDIFEDLHIISEDCNKDCIVQRRLAVLEDKYSKRCNNGKS